ncbi:MAG: RNase adapter RapZ [Acidimicrobiales bacterium]|nr:RNase adapter RapZ [Acidimicrobiales bacterium]
MSEFVVVTGLSGAGRTQAAHALEDLGWFVIDNLPPPLIPNVVDLAAASDGPGTAMERIVLVSGAGGYPADELARSIAWLRESGATVRVLFLEASVDTLVRRYESTRRRHPFPAEGVMTDSIVAERNALESVRGEADLVIDTSELNVHQLRERVQGHFGSAEGDEGMRVTVESFGFKHGLPRDVDMVIDCRFLPNPHWVPELQPQTGLDEPVKRYVLDQPVTAEFLERTEGLLEMLLPAYVREGKSYFTIAFGCTGGRHRAVAITEHVASSLKELGYDPTIVHRDKDK